MTLVMAGVPLFLLARLLLVRRLRGRHLAAVVLGLSGRGFAVSCHPDAQGQCECCKRSDDAFHILQPSPFELGPVMAADFFPGPRRCGPATDMRIGNACAKRRLGEVAEFARVFGVIEELK